MRTGAKGVAAAMTYVAMGISAAILVTFAMATLHFWGLASGSFRQAGGIPGWDPLAAVQGAFAGILDYAAIFAVVSGLYFAWIYAVLALCCGIMTMLGVRRAWLRLRDLVAAA